MIRHALLTTCALTLSAAAWAQDGGTITVADNLELASGWDLASDGAYVGTHAGCFESLVRVDFDMTLKPGLATAWTQTAPDVWEFKLREGVTFHDGQPLNAGAAANALNTQLAAEVPARAFSPKLVKSVEAVGDDVVRITTVEPSVLLPAQMASPATTILSPAAYADGKINPVGACTGPFKITEVDPSQSVTVVRNDDYWGGAPALAGAQIRFIPDANTRATQARTGEADIVRLVPPSSLSQLEGDENIKVARVEAPRITELLLNNKKPPLDNPQVRKAIRMAIDSAAIAASVYEGAVSPAASPFAPKDPWAPQGVEATYDVEGAKALLKEAGVEPGSLTLGLLAYTAKTELKDVAAIIQAQLAEIGINVNVRVADYNAIEPDMLAGNYDMALLSRGYLTDVAEPFGFLNADFTCEGSYNLTHYCDQATTQLIASAASMADPKDRFAVYSQAAQKISEQNVAIFLVHETTFDAHSAKLSNYQPHPLNYFVLTKELALQE